MTERVPVGTVPGERLYSLSFLGAHLAFMPIFTLLLPRRIAVIAPEQAIETLSSLLLIGGSSPASRTLLPAGGATAGL